MFHAGALSGLFSWSQGATAKKEGEQNGGRLRAHRRAQERRKHFLQGLPIARGGNAFRGGEATNKQKRRTRPIWDRFKIVGIFVGILSFCNE